MNFIQKLTLQITILSICATSLPAQENGNGNDYTSFQESNQSSNDSNDSNSNGCCEATTCCEDDCEAYFDASRCAHWSAYVPVAILVGAAIWLGYKDKTSSTDSGHYGSILDYRTHSGYSTPYSGTFAGSSNH